MPTLSRTTVLLLSLGAGLAAFFVSVVEPKLKVMGVGREVVPLNNGQCYAVPGLEACEDAWVDEETETAYLACSDPVSRKNWTPATLHLNASALPPVSTDYVAVLDLPSRSYQKLHLHGLPVEANGVWVHGIEVVRDPKSPKHLTLLLNSHRPPKDRATAPQVGADSVIEVFETVLGSKEAVHVRTVEHPLIRTPNNMAAVSKTGFYVSNDHRYKTHWTRPFELLKPVPSDIVYCDISTDVVDCKVAADNVVYPNGLAKGPGNLLYQASSLDACVHIWEALSDHTLVPLQVIPIARPLDNIHVHPSTGEIYTTALAKVLDFFKFTETGPYTNQRAAVEVWRVRNTTEEKEKAEPLSRQYVAELAFADTGEIVSGSTSGVPFKDKLLLTGLVSKEVVVCKLA
ncbi:hypothetical protein JCM8097_007177 [Rhodosporidiobolus ruineniae]